VFEIYSKLWTSVEHIGEDGPGRRVVYVNECRTEMGTSFFNPEGTGGRPELRIHNPDREEPSARPLDDAHLLLKLITLSHEAGHAISWQTNADGAWAEYFAAISHLYNTLVVLALQQFGTVPEQPMHAAATAIVGALSERERDVIWREETRAWEIGERELRVRGFVGWPAFEARRAGSLRSHAVRLGRVAFEPGEYDPTE
jgi:hypothetical protein